MVVHCGSHCVVGVADKTTLFCCWETNKPGGVTVHYNVNKYSEVNTKGGRLADWHVRSTISLIWHLSDDF